MYFCLSLPYPWAGELQIQTMIFFLTVTCYMCELWRVVWVLWLIGLDDSCQVESGLRVGESHNPYGCPGSSATWSQMRSFSGWSLNQTAGAGIAGVLRKNMQSGQHHWPLGAKRLTNCGAWGHIWHGTGLLICRNIWRCFDDDFCVRSS